MHFIGIDIGSTAAKAAVFEDDQLAYTVVMPTGFNGVDAANRLADDLRSHGYDPVSDPTVATGYGRVSVPFAAKTVTEITCHGLGADYLFGDDGLVIDIGGQDTKAIYLQDGKVKKFGFYPASAKLGWPEGHLWSVPMAERDEYSDSEFAEALEAYRRQPIADSLASENPIQRMFAIVDRRVGKRTLQKLTGSVQDQPEWLRVFYLARMEAEGVAVK